MKFLQLFFLQQLKIIFTIILISSANAVLAGGSSSSSNGVLKLAATSYGYNSLEALFPCDFAHPESDLEKAEAFTNIWKQLYKLGIPYNESVVIDPSSIYSYSLPKGSKVEGIFECTSFVDKKSSESETKIICQMTIDKVYNINHPSDIEINDFRGKKILLDGPEKLITQLKILKDKLQSDNHFKVHFQSVNQPYYVKSDNTRHDFLCLPPTLYLSDYLGFSHEIYLPSENIMQAIERIPGIDFSDWNHVETGILECNANEKNTPIASCTIQIGNKKVSVNNPEEIIDELINVKPVDGNIFYFKGVFRARYYNITVDVTSLL